MRISALRNIRIPVTVAVVAILTPIAIANTINDQLAALTEEKRQTIFKKMMQREGERCSNVSRTFFQGFASDRSAFWSISCTGGKDWQIMIKNTAQGDIKMLDCGTLKAVGGGQCFVAFKSKK